MNRKTSDRWAHATFVVGMSLIAILFCVYASIFWVHVSEMANQVELTRSPVQMQSSHTTASMRDAMWKALELPPEAAIVALNNLRKADEGAFLSALEEDLPLRNAVRKLVNSLKQERDRRKTEEEKRRHRKEYV